MLGKPRAFIHLFIFIAVLGVVLAIGSQLIDSAIGLLGVGFLVVGSIVTLWRSWTASSSPQAHAFPSQLSALPSRWQKWILGDGEDSAKK